LASASPNRHKNNNGIPAQGFIVSGTQREFSPASHYLSINHAMHRRSQNADGITTLG
jgi:hypothetical protein